MIAFLYDTAFMSIQFLFWLIVAAVILIGNLTYADYYTKLESKQLTTPFWVLFGFSYGLGALMFLMASGIIGVLDDSEQSRLEPSTVALLWSSSALYIIYCISLMCAVVEGFSTLKKYFGKKRNKI